MEIASFGLIGASSQALEVLDFAAPGSVKFFLSNDPSVIGSTIQDVPVVDIETAKESFVHIPVMPAVGAPGLKQKLVQSWKGSLAPAVVATTAYVSNTAEVGVGSIVAPKAVVMTQAQIGQCVLINAGATISHDTVIGEFTTISPGVNVGGNCTIGEGVFIGIGATVIQGINIASGSYIAAGAVVTKNITEPGTYIGVPARYSNNKNVWALSL